MSNQGGNVQTGVFAPPSPQLTTFHDLFTTFSEFFYNFFMTYSGFVHLSTTSPSCAHLLRLASDLFITCSLFVNDLFMTLYDLFMTCSWLDYELFMNCSQLFHNFWKSYLRLVLDSFTTCSQLFHIFLQLVHTLFIWKLFLHDLFMICSWLVHSLFTIYLQLIKTCYGLIRHLFTTIS